MGLGAVLEEKIAHPDRALSLVRISGNPNRQQISRKVNCANVSFDVGEAAAAAMIVLVVQSTQGAIQLLPDLVVSNGPIMSMAQLVKGCTGIAENCGIPDVGGCYPASRTRGT